MNKEERFQMANDFDFYCAVTDAIDGANPLQRNPFHTIGDRMRLIEELEKQGFVITKVEKVAIPNKHKD